MVEVALWSSLRPFAGGSDRVEVEAKTVGEVLERLAEAHPGLVPHIEAGVSVAVNGQIIASDMTKAVPEGAEVVLMQRLKGG